MYYSPAPIRSPAVVPGLWTLTPEFVRWLLEQYDAVVAAPRILGSAQKNVQVAALALGDVPTPKLTAGLYRVSVHAQVTRAATTSSSLNVTVRWTYNGTAQSRAFAAALVGNALTTWDALCFPIRVDANTRVRYETAYASVGGTTMQYSVDVALEALAV